MVDEQVLKLTQGEEVGMESIPGWRPDGTVWSIQGSASVCPSCVMNTADGVRAGQEGSQMTAGTCSPRFSGRCQQRGF